jgi:hypothetical protein
VWVEIKSVGLRGAYHFVETGKTESHQQIDAQRAEDGFGIGLIPGEDVAENDHNNEQVKNQAEGHVEYRKRTQLGLGKKDAVEQGGNCQDDGKNKQAAMDFGGVDADENGGTSNDEKGVAAEAAGSGIGKDD